MKLVSPAAVSAFFLPLALGGTEDIAYCDGCWCIPEAGESCPADYVPQIDFTDEFLSNLQNFALENPMQLSCDPYQEENCDTQPPLEDGAACVAEITRPEGDADCPSEGYSYRYEM